MRLDYRYAIMNRKFIMVDGEALEDRSFKYTRAAAKSNGENVIVIHDAAVARKYGQEWDRLLEEGE